MAIGFFLFLLLAITKTTSFFLSPSPHNQNYFCFGSSSDLEMGQCVSVQKSSSKLVEPHNISQPSLVVVDDVTFPIDSRHVVDFGGSKEEEMFFDSRAWLDSDCEDDFMSVDGDFTPSRGTTPDHPRLSPTLNNTNNNKRLLELFKEANSDDDDLAAESKPTTCMWLRTPVRSSAPTTPSDGRRRLRSVSHGCIPRMVSCSSFTERHHRKMMSPATVSVDGKS